MSRDCLQWPSRFAVALTTLFGVSTIAGAQTQLPTVTVTTPSPVAPAPQPAPVAAVPAQAPAQAKSAPAPAKKAAVPQVASQPAPAPAVAPVAAPVISAPLPGTLIVIDNAFAPVTWSHPERLFPNKAAR